MKRYVLPAVNPGDSISWSALSDSQEIREYEIDRERGTQGFVTYEGVEFHELPYAKFGDYDNSTQTERSNHRVLAERYPWLVRVTGDYGSRMIGYLGSLDEPFGADEYDAEHDNDPGTSAKALAEDIESLESYPILDESDESELEMLAEQEAWSEYGCRDFASWLTEPHKGIPNFGIPAGIPLAMLTEAGEIAFTHDITYAAHPGDPSEAARRQDLGEIWFTVLAEYGSGETSRHEGGGGVYFDCDDWYRTIWGACRKRTKRISELETARADATVGKLEVAIANGDHAARDVLCDHLSERGFNQAVDHLRYYARDSLGDAISKLEALGDEWADDDEESEAAA